MSLSVVWRRVARAVWAPAALLGLVAACGGGTSQIEAFVPQRLIVFGDEYSVIVNDGAANGLKYTINGIDASAARDCLLLPNWVQSLASNYGFVFAECNRGGALPQALMRAKVGARVEDPVSGIAAQLAEQVASGGPVKSGDMIAIMLGANDLIELANRVQAGDMSADAAVAEARRRGTSLAERINDMLATGARAIVSTVPDLGFSPFAQALESQTPGSAARLSSLTFEFNATLRTSIDSSRFDGRNFGLVLADDVVQAMARLPNLYNLSNVTDAACIKFLPDCTSAAADLASGASASTHLWADSRRLAPQAQAQIGAQAVSRAQNNPF